MSDIFQEVDEEVRREKLQQLWERHSNLIVAAALAVVIAVGGWRGYDWWENKKAAESGEAFEAALNLAESGKQDESRAAFAKLAQDGSSGYRILARFREAAELAKTDPAAGAAAYNALATSRWLSGPATAIASWSRGLVGNPLERLTAAASPNSINPHQKLISLTRSDRAYLIPRSSRAYSSLRA